MVTWPDLVTWLCMTQDRNFHKSCQNYGGYGRWKPGGAARRRFPCYPRKTAGGGVHTPPPPPVGRRLSLPSMHNLRLHRHCVDFSILWWWIISKHGHALAFRKQNWSYCLTFINNNSNELLSLLRANFQITFNMLWTTVCGIAELYVVEALPGEVSLCEMDPPRR